VKSCFPEPCLQRPAHKACAAFLSDAPSTSQLAPKIQAKNPTITNSNEIAHYSVFIFVAFCKKTLLGIMIFSLSLSFFKNKIIYYYLVDGLQLIHFLRS